MDSGEYFGKPFSSTYTPQPIEIISNEPPKLQPVTVSATTPPQTKEENMGNSWWYENFKTNKFIILTCAVIIVALISIIVWISLYKKDIVVTEKIDKKKKVTFDDNIQFSPPPIFNQQFERNVPPAYQNPINNYVPPPPQNFPNPSNNSVFGSSYKFSNSPINPIVQPNNTNPPQKQVPEVNTHEEIVKKVDPNEVTNFILIDISEDNKQEDESKKPLSSIVEIDSE